VSVCPTLGLQLLDEFPKRKVLVKLLTGEEIKGTFFTAQNDFLQVDDESGLRVTVPFTAVAFVAPG
jgi:hypothetical protein